MKRIIYIVLAITTIATSCKKFLEEMPPSIVLPSNADHYEELLYGSGYPSNTNGYSKFIELPTDDVEWIHIPNPNSAYLPLREYTTKEGWGIYLYINDPESITSNGTDAFWGECYKSIAVCNVVIEGLAKLKDDNETLRRHIKGQAHFLRALHYLNLMNMYGMPYVKGQDSEWGVPIKTSTIPEDRAFQRNTVHEVYALMKADADSGVALCDPNQKLKIYEANWYAAVILASRIHLYMENYDEVIRLGEMYLSRKSELPPSTAALTNGLFTGFTAAWSGVSPNPEVVFNYGTNPSTYNSVYQASTGYDYFHISQSLRDEFAKSLKPGEVDNRLTNPAGNVASWFFGVASSRLVPRKIYNFNTRKSSFRTGELILNLAEAYAKKGQIDNAVSQLNYLRSSRIQNYQGFTSADFTQESLITFTREERRRELCFEDHRLPDLKRYGMPALEHIIQDFTGRYRVRLEQGDFGYIFQIPLKERNLNYEIKRLPRPERIIEPI